MNIFDLIKQLSSHLSGGNFKKNQIAELRPINLILDPKMLGQSKDKIDNYSIFCALDIEKKDNSKTSDYDDIPIVEINDKELHKQYLNLPDKDKDQLIIQLNLEIFSYIQNKVSETKRLNAWDKDNIWYEPNKRFTNWFQIRDIVPDLKIKKGKGINDALWAIADDMRARKEDGEFETYRQAYRWAEHNLVKKGSSITAHKLEKAWHKARSSGLVGEVKQTTASIPFMITNKMRQQLKNLGCSKAKIRELTPQEAWDIINNKS